MRGLTISLILMAHIAAGQSPDAARFFDDRVEPILRARCLGCHNQQLKDGGISFLDRDSLLRGGSRGPAIIPGKPEASMLIQAVRQNGDVKMPPGAKLPAEDIATLAEWIERGAVWGSKLRPPASELWRIDNLERIGGHPVTVLGHPRIIETPKGRAVEFNGVDDALFLDVHPLAGAETFTWEVIFRPDAGGGAEQRFFHLQQRDSQNRLLLEIRVIGRSWCLDAYAISGDASHTLIDRERLHPLGAWYHVAMVYDGLELRDYVDGVLEGAARLKLAPQGEGHCSIGVRINRRDYFKGAIAVARLTRGALAPAEFLKVPE